MSLLQSHDSFINPSPSLILLIGLARKLWVNSEYLESKDALQHKLLQYLELTVEGISMSVQETHSQVIKVVSSFASDLMLFYGKDTKRIERIMLSLFNVIQNRGWKDKATFYLLGRWIRESRKNYQAIEKWTVGWLINQ